MLLLRGIIYQIISIGIIYIECLTPLERFWGHIHKILHTLLVITNQNKMASQIH